MSKIRTDPEGQWYVVPDMLTARFDEAAKHLNHVCDNDPYEDGYSDALDEFRDEFDAYKIDKNELFLLNVVEPDPNALLGIIAFNFRGIRNEEERKRLAGEYAKEVDRLIATGKWDESPGPEDQLPHDLMPKAYFDYWS